jgi:hypothetical protein
MALFGRFLIRPHPIPSRMRPTAHVWVHYFLSGFTINGFVSKSSWPNGPPGKMTWNSRFSAFMGTRTECEQSLPQLKPLLTSSTSTLPGFNSLMEAVFERLYCEYLAPAEQCVINSCAIQMSG